MYVCRVVGKDTFFSDKCDVYVHSLQDPSSKIIHCKIFSYVLPTINEKKNPNDDVHFALGRQFSHQINVPIKNINS